MEKLLNQLKDVLSENLTLYQAMGRALESEKEALKAHDLDLLEVAITNKNSISALIAGLEKSRLAIADALAEKLGIEVADLAMTEIVKHADKKLADQLLILRGAMRKIVAEVTEQNNFNRAVIEKLTKINFEAADNLKELIEPSGGYMNKGQMSRELGSGKVVSQTY